LLDNNIQNVDTFHKHNFTVQCTSVEPFQRVINNDNNNNNTLKQVILEMKQ